MTAAQDEWVRCKSWIESALPYTGGTHDIEDIERGVFSGSMLFVPGKHMAVVLEVAIYPNFKVLDVFLGGGEGGGKTMREYCEQMDAYLVYLAKQLGCKWVRHFCREGSTRVGEKIGYRKLCTVMIKDVA